MGDTVNVAQRLQVAASRDQILVGSPVRRLTYSAIQYGKPKTLRVRGRQEKVVAHEALGLREVREVSEQRVADLPPLVGREEEMEVLADLLERLRAGGGAVVCIVGEAGIGKSRLKYELHQRAEGVTWLEGECSRIETPPAYDVFAQIVREVFAVAPEDGELEVRRKLAAGLRELDASLEPSLPYLGAILSLGSPTLVTEEESGRQGKTREAFLNLVAAQAARGPLVLVLEDLHWSDDLSRAMLQFLAPRIAESPILLCCVYRPEFRPEWAEQPGVTRLQVESLEADHTQRLVAELLGTADVPQAAAEFISHRAEGNPFYVEEMTKALLDEGILTKARGGWHLAKDPAQASLPATVEGVILARIDRLHRQAREALECASVVGRTFGHRLLGSVVGSEEGLEEQLAALEERDFIYRHTIEAELQYIFKHFTIREAAYNGILLKRRRQLHLRTARAIEALYAEHLSEYYEVLAHHYEQAEAWSEAADYYGRAAGRSREGQSDTRAEDLHARRETAVRRLYETGRVGMSTWVYLAILPGFAVPLLVSVLRGSAAAFVRVGASDLLLVSTASALMLVILAALIARTLRHTQTARVSVYHDSIAVSGIPLWRWILGLYGVGDEKRLGFAEIERLELDFALDLRWPPRRRSRRISSRDWGGLLSIGDIGRVRGLRAVLRDGSCATIFTSSWLPFALELRRSMMRWAAQDPTRRPTQFEPKLERLLDLEESRYVVRGEKGETFGPMTRVDLTHRILARKVNQESSVQRFSQEDGSAFASGLPPAEAGALRELAWGHPHLLAALRMQRRGRWFKAASAQVYFRAHGKPPYRQLLLRSAFSAMVCTWVLALLSVACWAASEPNRIAPATHTDPIMTPLAPLRAPKRW